MNEDIFSINGESLGVLISLPEKDNFNIIKETLTRIGVRGRDIDRATGELLSDAQILWQSCHIFHKRGQYAIMHFKEMMAFDGKEVNLTDQDIKRRDTIANLLQQWDLCEIIDEEISKKIFPNLVTIVPSSQKNNWDLRAKYTIGRQKNSIRPL